MENWVIRLSRTLRQLRSNFWHKKHKKHVRQMVLLKLKLSDSVDGIRTRWIGIWSFSNVRVTKNVECSRKISWIYSLTRQLRRPQMPRKKSCWILACAHMIPSSYISLEEERVNVRHYPNVLDTISKEIGGNKCRICTKLGIDIAAAYLRETFMFFVVLTPKVVSIQLRNLSLMQTQIYKSYNTCSRLSLKTS